MPIVLSLLLASVSWPAFAQSSAWDAPTTSRETQGYPFEYSNEYTGNYGRAMAPIPTSTATPPTQDYTALLPLALQQGNTASATVWLEDWARQPLSASEQRDIQYYQALNALTAGRYETALQHLAQHTNWPPEYQALAQDLIIDISLFLADVHLAKQQPELAENALLALSSIPLNHTQALTLRRLQAALSTQHGTPNSSRKNAPPAKIQPVFVRVGVLLPLSGPKAALGETILRALQLAIFQHEAVQFVLYPQDTGDTPEQAEQAAQLLRQNNVDVIIGPVFAEQTRVISNIVHQNTPIFALTSAADTAAPGLYPLGYRPDQQTRAVVRYALSQGKTRVAAIIPDTDYGRTTLAALTDELARHNLIPDPVVMIAATAVDVQQDLAPLLNLAEGKRRRDKEITALQTSATLLAAQDLELPPIHAARLKYLTTNRMPPAAIDFTALFLPLAPQQLQLVTSQLALYDVDKTGVLYLGTALWDHPSLGKGAPYVPNGVFPRVPLHTKLAADYLATYGENMPKMAQVAVTALEILAQVITEQPDIPLLNALTRPYGFANPAGAAQFGAAGYVARQYDLMHLTPSQTRLLHPAPTLFAPGLPSPLHPALAPATHSPIQWFAPRQMPPFTPPVPEAPITPANPAPSDAAPTNTTPNNIPPRGILPRGIPFGW